MLDLQEHLARSTSGLERAVPRIGVAMVDLLDIKGELL